MSLLSPETLSLHIASDRIQAVRCMGWRNKPVDFLECNVTVSASDGWHGLLQGIEQLSEKVKVRAMRVVLSDKFARYSNFPWRSDLLGPQEDLAIARLNFDETYGSNESADWHFGFSAARPGQSRLSIAIPLSLFTLLQSNFGNSAYQVKSVQTAFCATMRSYRTKLNKQGWIVTLEGGRLTVGSWDTNAWNWIHSAHAELNSAEALLERIRHELQLSCISLNVNQPVPIYLHAPAFENSQFGRLDGATFIPLHNARNVQSPQYTYALLGAQA